jgi:hypothetical protein
MFRCANRGKVFADTLEHEMLDLGGGHAGDAAGFGLSLLHDRVRHVVPMAIPSCSSMQPAAQ